MGYRARSRYTQGGGVLAFFDQVSRFVALSVVAWVSISVLFIFFNTNGKLTDSLELHILKGIFSDGKLFGTVLLLVSISGIIGALISLPSAFVLLMTRQYLDFQMARSSRRGNVLKVYFLRYLPIFVLVISHCFALMLNLLAAPQLSRALSSEGSELSRLITAGHFVMNSLTHRSQEQKIVGSEAARATEQNSQAHRFHLIFLPADLIESQEFRTEISKIDKWRQMPFVIQRSSVREQIDGIFSKVSGPVAGQVKELVRLGEADAKAASSKTGEAVVAVSPQLTFGSKLAGYGSENLTSFNKVLALKEKQRRIVLSQLHVFGVLKLFDGLSNFGETLGWNFLVADDVARLREVGRARSTLMPNSHAFVVLQLSGLENSFGNVVPPFRPQGWSLVQSSYEKRLVTKNLVSEIFHYTDRLDKNVGEYWILLPFADDRRVEPKSYAIVSENSALDLSDALSFGANFGAVSEDLADKINKVIDGKTLQNGDQSSVSKQSETSRQIPEPSAKAHSEKRMKCSETEVDFASTGFQFLSSEAREHGFSQLLNAISIMSDVDLAFLSKSVSRLVGRDLGLGLLCKSFIPELNHVYLLKHKGGYSSVVTVAELTPTSSVVLGTSERRQPSGEKSIRGRAFVPPESPREVKLNFEPDVLKEFLILKNGSSQVKTTSGQQNSEWLALDALEAKAFYSQFEVDTLSAIERSARARIR